MCSTCSHSPLMDDRNTVIMNSCSHTMHGRREERKVLVCSTKQIANTASLAGRIPAYFLFTIISVAVRSSQTYTSFISSLMQAPIRQTYLWRLGFFESILPSLLVFALLPALHCCLFANSIIKLLLLLLATVGAVNFAIAIASSCQHPRSSSLATFVFTPYFVCPCVGFL